MNGDPGAVCPHCQAPTYGVSHFTSATDATKAGTTLCTRAGGRIARGDYWGWACAPDHTCHAGRLPLVPDPDIS